MTKQEFIDKWEDLDPKSRIKEYLDDLCLVISKNFNIPDPEHSCKNLTDKSGKCIVCGKRPR
jgi:hypothetical protein